MTQRAPTTVIFDIGGVLVDWDPRYLYRKLFDGDDDLMEWFLANVCHQSWNEEQDAGRSFAHGVEVLSRKYPEHRELIAAYDRRWDEMLGGPIEGSVRLLDELKSRGVPLYALTNWSHEKFPVARERFPFLARFDGIVVSGEEGVIKPAAELFRILLERHRVRAEDSVFIDDAPRNVDGAIAVGMRGIRFTGADALRAELGALGLLG